jgi:hypothetical protein
MKNTISIRPNFYICSIFAAKWKRDEKFRKRDGKRARGYRERDRIRDWIYPARIYGIPFLTGMDSHSSFFIYTGYAQ